ncbi:hypothetical protein [Clostridium magnum]|uniref:GDSL-like lipase/acylhydrolase n=1 Tax=Clostridium magnum DSM 2767 TaxID=1121326 RepID=A0A161WSB9_9CLOT|nr:hypothetical protein [Clostridium magnum]KZL89678.1 hypothetical protein CLMAG_51780 [Clostridium magnum DSM 2767]SHH76161.1 hypothetical protein SAMN02745944_01360 [Clostridium magnum DSM 2767]
MRQVCIGDSLTYGYGVRAKKNWNFIDSFKATNDLIIEFSRWIKKFSNHNNINTLLFRNIYTRIMKI